MDARKRYFVDLFAGCGGLSLGLEEAGFLPALVNELNKDAMETYLINRDCDYPLLRAKYNTADVWDMVDNPEKLNQLVAEMKQDYGFDAYAGDLDLLVGGPPCQGYSGIGHRRHYSVEKKEIPSNHLFEAMVELIKRLKPKVFLFENVKGILSGRWTSAGEKGEIWEDVHTAFENIPGYSVRWKLVHAKDYGAPQNRPRVLLVGLRNDVFPQYNNSSLPEDAVQAGFLPAPTKDYPDLVDLLGDLDNQSFEYASEDTHYVQPAATPIQRKLRTRPDGTLMKKGSELTEQEYSNHSERIIEKFKCMHENGGEIPEQFRTKKFAQRLLPPRWDEKGPTITACCLADDYVHYSEPRVLTVREWARLQMFPDWYQFAGKRTTGGLRRAGNPREGAFERELPKYTQIGNAVPVVLAENVGKHFMKLLEENDA